LVEKAKSTADDVFVLGGEDVAGVQDVEGAFEEFVVLVNSEADDVITAVDSWTREDRH
jgi:hypothetical protein